MSDRGSRFRFRADLQGLRGLAVLLVVLYHAALPVYGGFVGVDVFFVISGFVITGGMLDRLRRDEFGFADFYARRVRRLLPTLSLVLVATTLFSVLLGPQTSMTATGRTGAAASLLNANHYLYRQNSYFNSNSEYNALLHTWSLSVEEQFYLVFPLLLFIGWRVGCSKRGALPFVVGSVAVGAFALNMWLTHTPTVLGFDGPRLAFFASFTRAWEFAIGALLAVFAGFIRDSLGALKVPRAADALGLLGMSLVLAASFGFSKATVFPGIAALVPAIGAALLMLPGMVSDSPLANSLSHPLLTRLGDLSYSWYLWHWPAIVFVRASYPTHEVAGSVGAAAVSLLLAFGTEKYFETPIRYRNRDKRWPTLVVAALCIGAPLTALTMQRQVRDVAWIDVQGSLRRAEKSYRDIGCLSNKTLSDPDPRCVTGSGTLRVALIGDSNARQHIPGVRAAVDEIGGTLTAVTTPACPFLTFDAAVSGVPQTDCSTWRDAVLRELETHDFDVVIISSAWDGYATHSNWRLFDGGIQIPADDRVSAVSENLTGIARRIESQGAVVIYVSPIPKFRSRALPVHDFLSAGGARCSLVALELFSENCALSRLLHRDPRFLDFAVVQKLMDGARSEGVGVVDTSKILCPDDVCRMLRDGEWIYRDDGHITPYASLLTQQLFVEELRQIAPSGSRDR